MTTVTFHVPNRIWHAMSVLFKLETATFIETPLAIVLVCDTGAALSFAVPTNSGEARHLCSLASWTIRNRLDTLLNKVGSADIT
jgi:hypothetical protein